MRKRGQIYSPGGYRLDCMDCNTRTRFTDDDRQNSAAILWRAGWAYYRGWYCPNCAQHYDLHIPRPEGARQHNPGPARAPAPKGRRTIAQGEARNERNPG